MFIRRPSFGRRHAAYIRTLRAWQFKHSIPHRPSQHLRREALRDELLLLMFDSLKKEVDE